MERKKSLAEIYLRYLAGETSKEEEAALLRHFLEYGHDSLLRQVIEEQLDTEQPVGWEDRPGVQAVFERVEDGLRSGIHLSARQSVRVGRLKKWLPYAAAAIVAAALGSWLLTVRTAHQSGHGQLVGVAAILPGSNRATLTLSDGRTIALSESQEGIIIGDGVTYSDGSEVLDSGIANPSTEETSDTTRMSLTTPRGGIYQVSLPDGSNVWLNANSTLKYPARFNDDERVVFLTGEAYFQISAVHVPFRVVSTAQTVEVLGTEFNISAYPDDAETKTTLVKGRVKVALPGNSDANATVLKPGQQSTLANGGLHVNEVDTDQYIAWKNNEFMFDEASIDEVMKAVERWYDVNVVYEEPKPKDRFGGGLSRFEDVSKVLELLEQTGGVTFRIEGRTIYVKTKTN